MEIQNMTDAETAEHIRAYTAEGSNFLRPFSWPTDACGYDQHIKFVNHRNKNWHGGSRAEWEKFALDYADSLEEPQN